MSLLLLKDSNALKKALIFSLMKTHLTVILYISQLIKKNALSQEQRFPSLWKCNINFSLVAKLLFCYNWILTPLTLTDIKGNALALNGQVGSWAHDRAAKCFWLQVSVSQGRPMPGYSLSPQRCGEQHQECAWLCQVSSCSVFPGTTGMQRHS